MTSALRFFLLIEVLGLAATPLAAVIFARLPGAGLGFAKPLGLLLATWLVWIGGSSGLVPYGTAAAIGACVLVAAAGALAWWRWRPRERRGLWLRAFLWAEGIGLVAFAAMALAQAYSPDVWLTEKPMDMAFVNAADGARSFPPGDPWMAGEDLNYYYLGHLMTAMLVRLTAVEPSVGYNLAVAGFFALSATAAFAIGVALRGRIAAGLLTVALVLVLGTVGGGEQLLSEGGPLRAYDWFAASRVIDGTINEFPSFSFVLADLHAHVMAIPFSLLALGIALQLAVAGPPPIDVRRGAAGLELGAGAVAIGALYAINAWSFPVFAGIVVLGGLVRLRDPGLRLRERARTLTWVLALGLLAIIAVLPFLLTYDPAADGLGTVGERASFSEWARDHMRIYGLVAYLAATAYAAWLASTRHPWRNLAWIVVAAIVAGSLLAGAHLTGVAALVVLGGVAAHAGLVGRRPAPERFVWVLIGSGLLCLAIGELVYVRDSFNGGELFRMNTVFKLGYQAWLLLAVAVIPVALWALTWLPRGLRVLWALGLLVLLALSLAFPVAGTYARKAGFSASPTLDGRRWLERTAPGDVAAIDWLRERAPRGAVVLESTGDDYSAFGHARISTFTGLPTVMGWVGHELQWGHDPGRRRQEVERLYSEPDPAAARADLSRYDVRYVVVGPLERADYGDAGLAKWDQLGRRVFDRDGTVLWDLKGRL